jgi:hypothetical protein
MALVTLAGCMAMGSLSGCAGAKRAFGMEKVAPDEFTVVTKPPLVLPPDYSLRPPRPGAPSPSDIEPVGNAETALFGREGLSENAQGYTSGEVGLLETTGGSGVNPNIRKVLNAETASLIEKDASIADKILFWQEPSEEKAEVIDAAKEAERLKNGKTVDKTDGKPAEIAKKPEGKPKKKGWFEGLF